MTAARFTKALLFKGPSSITTVRWQCNHTSSSPADSRMWP